MQEAPRPLVAAPAVTLLFAGEKLLLRGGSIVERKLEPELIATMHLGRDSTTFCGKGTEHSHVRVSAVVKSQASWNIPGGSEFGIITHSWMGGGEGAAAWGFLNTPPPLPSPHTPTFIREMRAVGQMGYGSEQE